MRKKKNGYSSISEPSCETCAKSTTFFSNREFSGITDKFLFGVPVPKYVQINDERGSRTETMLITENNNYSLTPHVEAVKYKMSEILKSGQIPAVVSPLSGLNKLQVASLTDAAALSLSSQLDQKLSESKQNIQSSDFVEEPVFESPSDN